MPTLGHLYVQILTECISMRRIDKLKKTFPFLAHFHVYRVGVINNFHVLFTHDKAFWRPCGFLSCNNVSKKMCLEGVWARLWACCFCSRMVGLEQIWWRHGPGLLEGCVYVCISPLPWGMSSGQRHFSPGTWCFTVSKFLQTLFKALRVWFIDFWQHISHFISINSLWQYEVNY